MRYIIAIIKKKANVFKYQGSCEFEELPTSGNEVGDVWNITDEFTLDGKHYDAGTNVAWDGEAWDALSASIDTSIFELNANKVTSLSDQSTDEQYPSAKVVFDGLKNTAVAHPVDTVRGTSGYFDFFSAAPGIYVPGVSFEQLQYYTQRKNLTTLQNGIFWTQFNTDWETNTRIGSAMVFMGMGTLTLYEIYYRNNKSTNTEYITMQQAGQNNFSFTALTNASHLTQDILGTKNFDKLPQMKNYIAPTTNVQFTPKKYVDDNVAKYTTMPTATVDTIGKIVQYVGTTDQNYTAGYFYIGTTDGGDPATYSWEQIDVQPDFSAINAENPPTQAQNAIVLSEMANGIYMYSSWADYKPFYIKETADSEAVSIGTIKPLCLIIYQNVTTVGPTQYATVYHNFAEIFYVTNDEKINLVRAYLGKNNSNTVILNNANSWGQLLLNQSTQRIYGEKQFMTCPKASSIPTVNSHLANKGYVDGVAAKRTEMSTHTGDLGKIVQYIGETDANYTKGYFYIEVQTSVAPERYSWEQINVQPAPVITTATSAQIQALFGTEGGE